MLEADTFMVKERVKFFKSHQTYDIFDYDTKEPIGTAEESIGGLVKFARWFVPKSRLPTEVEVREHDGALVFRIRRSGFLLRGRVEVFDADDERIGYFKSRRLSVSGGFSVRDRHDRPFAEARGNLVGLEFRILAPGGAELGRVTKEWGGVGRELFTSADTYMVNTVDDLAGQPVAKMLVLATALAVDMIFKSESRGGFGGKS